MSTADKMRAMVGNVMGPQSDPPAPMPRASTAPEKKSKDELLRAREERAKEEASRREAHELLCLELEDRFCSELGPRGQKWQMVNEDDRLGAGPICVKAPEITAWKLWQTKGTSYEDQYQYAAPTVLYPDRAQFNDVVARFPDLLGQCVLALAELAGNKMEALRGKL